MKKDKDKDEKERDKDKKKSKKEVKDKDKDKDKEKDKDKKSKKDAKDKDKSEIIEPEKTGEAPIKLNEICDGCDSPEAETYCSECGLILCKACEDQIHIIPSNQTHERFHLSVLAHIRKTCFHHKNSLQFYCESCDEPVCKDCSTLGPHSNKLHRVVNVIESFKKKHSYLLNLINNQLAVRSDQLENQLQEIENVANEVKERKDEIARAIQKEYNSHLANLREEEGKKLAIIQYNYNDVMAEVGAITDIINYFESLDTDPNPDMIEFLIKYKHISETIEGILNKQPRDFSELEVPINDFSEPLQEDNQKLAKYEKLKDLLNLKDDYIWTLINEKQSNVYSDELFFAKQELEYEIQEWGHLSFKYLRELKKFDKVCAFCGVKMDNKNINSQCFKNSEEFYKSVGDISIKTNYSDCQNIPKTYYSNGYHFFADPSKNYEEKVNKTIHSNHIINKSKDKLLETDILYVFDKMRRIAKNFNIDIEKTVARQFSNFGIVDSLALREFLISKFNLEDNEADVILAKICKKPEYNVLSNTGQGQFINTLNNSAVHGGLGAQLKISNAAGVNEVPISEILTFFNTMKKITSDTLPKQPIRQEANLVVKGGNFEVVNTSRQSSRTDVVPDMKSRTSFKYGSSKDNNKTLWILKVASSIGQNKMDMVDQLAPYDGDHDGYLTLGELRVALLGMNLRLTESDIESMFNYYSLTKTAKVNIRDFCKNFFSAVK